MALNASGLVGAVVLANVLSVGLLLLLYANFELLRGYLRPILWALLWALALFPVKERWANAIRLAIEEGPFALLPWPRCSKHSEGSAVPAEIDCRPHPPRSRVGPFWRGLLLSFGVYMVYSSVLVRTVFVIIAVAFFASPQCRQLTETTCTHGLRDAYRCWLAVGSVCFARFLSECPRRSIPPKMSAAIRAVRRVFSTLCTVVVAVCELVVPVLSLGVRTCAIPGQACMSAIFSTISVESGVAAVLTFGLLVGVVSGATLLGIQVALEWVDVALAFQAATTAALTVGGAHLGSLQAPIIAYAAAVQSSMNVSSAEDAMRVLQGWTAGVDVDSTVERGLDWIDGMWPNETVYVRQAWVAFKAYNESVALAGHDDTVVALTRATDNVTLASGPCSCSQDVTSACGPGSCNDVGGEHVCEATARADFLATRDGDFCTSIGESASASLPTSSPLAACGVDVSTLDSDQSITAIAYRAFAIVRQVLSQSPGALASPQCWWPLMSAAWKGFVSPQLVELAAPDDDESIASAIVSWLPDWMRPWAHRAESMIMQQNRAGGGDNDGGALGSLMAYLPSTRHLTSWLEALALHGNAVAAGVAASTCVALARLAAAGAAFLDTAISALLFINVLYYLLAAPKPWLQLMLEATLPAESAAATLDLITGNVSTLLAVNAQAAAFNGFFTFLLVGIVAQAHIATSCALLAAIAAVLPFFPVFLVVVPAAIQVGLRFDSPYFGIVASLGFVAVHSGALSAFHDAQLADAAERGLAATHAGILGLAILAGMAALGPEGAILGPLAVSLLACCGVLLAWSSKIPVGQLRSSVTPASKAESDAVPASDVPVDALSRVPQHPS